MKSSASGNKTRASHFSRTTISMQSAIFSFRINVIVMSLWEICRSCSYILFVLLRVVNGSRIRLMLRAYILCYIDSRMSTSIVLINELLPAQRRCNLFIRDTFDNVNQISAAARCIKSSGRS